MRQFCLLVLLAFAGVVVAFALQNQQEVTLSSSAKATRPASR
jgi:hypothetical protein